MFPISRDPPEGGTPGCLGVGEVRWCCFQFLGIPPKGELRSGNSRRTAGGCFQFLGIPPKGELLSRKLAEDSVVILSFPISRDPPEGGTAILKLDETTIREFRISRDPPEGGTLKTNN